MHRFAAAFTLLSLPIGGAAAQQQSDSAQHVSDSAQKIASASPARAKPLETVVVSATRTEQSLKSLAAQVVVLGEPAIAASTAQTVPDLLRTVPGFTTRDFQSGVVIGPTTSMVSFRGLGGSSTGRALVLLDGIPAGDPFSGWLDWGRIPLPMLQSAEVIRGGGSPIWGSRSLGGVINLRIIAPRRDERRVIMEGGSRGTYRSAGAVSVRRGRLSATLGADLLNTDGFVTLRANQAGPIDRREATTSRALLGKATWDATDALQVWAGGNIFTGGDRPLGYKKRQDFDEGRGGLRWLSPSGGTATLAVFANRRGARGKSWTINADRTAETPQRYNASPASSKGISLQWTQMAFARHELTAGADFSSASGSLTEQYRFVSDQPLEERYVGGTQQLGGFFLQDAADLGHGIRLQASVRADRVSNTNGRRTTRDLTLVTTIADSAFRDETTTTATYSLGVRWQQADLLAWRASVYEGFRAPSMYEMYYPRFSSRGTVTEANPDLDPELLRGAELGADLTLGGGFVTRITAFRNRVVVAHHRCHVRHCRRAGGSDRAVWIDARQADLRPATQSARAAQQRHRGGSGMAAVDAVALRCGLRPECDPGYCAGPTRRWKTGGTRSATHCHVEHRVRFAAMAHDRTRGQLCRTSLRRRSQRDRAKRVLSLRPALESRPRTRDGRPPQDCKSLRQEVRGNPHARGSG